MGVAGKKELLQTGGKPVLRHGLETFSRIGELEVLVVVVPAGEQDRYAPLLEGIALPVRMVEGGSTRQRSVLAALEALRETSIGFVLIHDGARPFVTPELIRSVCEGVVRFGACIPVVPEVHALKEVDGDGWIQSHPDRSAFCAAQTPQGFLYPAILEAHRRALDIGDGFNDDSEIWHRQIGKVWTVPGDPRNTKITYPSDLEITP